MEGMIKGEAGQAPGFKRPDLSKVVPPEQQDAVARTVAAGMKVMYSPEMKDQVLEVIRSDMPAARKLAESVVGLMLMLNQKAKGQIPVEAVFPAMMELMSEAAEMLIASKQKVTQQDFNEAANYAAILMATKMGATKEEAIEGLAKHIPGGADAGAEAEVA